MNNKERLLKGMLYSSDDQSIQQMKKKGKRLNYLLNQTSPDETEKRNQLIHELFGQIGEDVSLKPPFYCSHGCHIFIGNHCFINFDCIFLDLNIITIGNHVMIGPRVSIYTAAHPIDPTIRRSDLEYALPVTIGNDVWIGGNVVINPGVTIGNDVIIGSGSIVTKDIPDHVIVAGNPAKMIREITDEDYQYWKQQQDEYENSID